AWPLRAHAPGGAACRPPAGRGPAGPRSPACRHHPLRGWRRECRRKACCRGCSARPVPPRRCPRRPGTGFRSASTEREWFQSPEPRRLPPDPLSTPVQAGMFSSLPPKEPTFRWSIVAENPTGCQHNFPACATCCSSRRGGAVRLCSSSRTVSYCMMKNLLQPRELLRALAPGEPVSGEALADGIGVTRAAVWKHVAALRKRGLPVDARTGLGYSLPWPTQLLDADAVAAHLEDGAGSLEVHWELDSTSSELARRQDGLPDLAVVLAESQSAGRGRRGRAWLSPPGLNRYLSWRE